MSDVDFLIGDEKKIKMIITTLTCDVIGHVVVVVVVVVVVKMTMLKMKNVLNKTMMGS